MRGLNSTNCLGLTAYHPQANSLVERFHRQLKGSLKARLQGPHWMDELPLVLFSIRTAWREDPDCSASDLVYGTSLRIPGEFLPHEPRDLRVSSEFLLELALAGQTLHCTNNSPGFLVSFLPCTGNRFYYNEPSNEPLTLGGPTNRAGGGANSM